MSSRGKNGDGVTLESLKKTLERLTNDQKGIINRAARITDHTGVERLKK